jgi:hypothetical protein
MAKKKKKKRSAKTASRPRARAKRPAAKRTGAKRRTAPGTRARVAPASLPAPLKGADRMEVAGVLLEIGRAGAARVKRMIYPPGFRWSVHMKPLVGTDYCMHAHVGFLAHGRIHIEYPDGCVVEHTAPQIVSIEPGHDGWVVGKEPAVLIEFDFERDTIDRLGMPAAHQHE